MPKLILNGEILCSLGRCHERRELALLTFREIEASPLDGEQLIEQPCDLLLIGGITRQDLGAQRLTSASFFAKYLHAITLESVVDPTKLLHLRVIEIEPPPHDLGESLAKLSLQGTPLTGHARLSFERIGTL